MLKYENESGQARRGAMSSCVMVHLTLLYCSTTSTSAELVAVRRQAAMCVLAQATRAPEPQATLRASRSASANWRSWGSMVRRRRRALATSAYGKSRGGSSVERRTKAGASWVRGVGSSTSCTALAR